MAEHAESGATHLQHTEATTTGESRRRVSSLRRYLGALSPTQRGALLLIVGVALSLRIAWCVLTIRAPRIGDPVAYYFYGTQIAEGHGYNNFGHYLARIHEIVAGGPHVLPDHDIPTALFPPGYPAVLGALFWLVIRSPLPDNLLAAAVSLNVALSVATVLLAFEIARRLFDVRVGLVSAALLAVYPNLIYHTATLHWETTFIFIAMAALLVLLRRPWSQGQVPTRTLLGFAVLLGFSVLIRPMSLGIVAALFVASLVAGAGLRRALVQCGIVIGVVALMVLPWTVRNIVKMHSPVVISTEVGPALCVSRQPGAAATRTFRPCIAYCEPLMPEVPIERQEVENNDHAMAKSIEFVVHHPLWRAAALGAPHALRLPARPRCDGRRRLLPLRKLIPCAEPRRRLVLLRAVDAGGRRHVVVRGAPTRGRLLFLLTTVSLAATPILLYGAPRYKVPAMPFITLVAAAGAVTIFDRLHTRQPEPARARPATARRAAAR